MNTALTAVSNWSFSKKLLFRFLAAYLFLNIFPFPAGYIPLTDFINNFFSSIWDGLVVWTGKNVLHISYTIDTTPNGSGDTTYSYVLTFIVAILAIIATIIWSVIDRNRKNYNKFLYWIMLYVRYYLAFSMMSYGCYKIIKTQFPFPYYKLTETYGDSSPMGLLWNFMGYSKAYNIFTGIAEFLGGFLLFFRKTTLFGSLLSMVVLGNIVALNFCFDVPVKLYSSTLLLMALFIASPYSKRLIDFFFRNKAVPADKNSRPEFKKRWMNISLVVLKFLLIIIFIDGIVEQVWSGYKSYGDAQVVKQPLFGYYGVETFVRNNDTLPKLVNDTTQWKAVDIVSSRYVPVKLMNDSIRRYSFTIDTIRRTVKLYLLNDTFHKSTLSYSTPTVNDLILSGRLNNDTVYISMKKRNPQDFRLINRGFHWINEFPYNR